MPMSSPKARFRWGPGATTLACALAAVAAVYLLVDHRAHLLAWSPLLILLACPILHLAMHRSHHAHHPGPHQTGSRRDTSR